MLKFGAFSVWMELSMGVKNEEGIHHIDIIDLWVHPGKAYEAKKSVNSFR
jgi:hypothetical protein